MGSGVTLVLENQFRSVIDGVHAFLVFFVLHEETRMRSKYVWEFQPCKNNNARVGLKVLHRIERSAHTTGSLSISPPAHLVLRFCFVYFGIR